MKLIATALTLCCCIKIGLSQRPPPPEQRITCGGNYGWNTESWEGRPCQPPSWKITWELNLSTTPDTRWGPEIAVGNIPGFYPAVNASRWGWITFDWSIANALWQNHHPHDNEAVMVEQCRMVKAEGTGTRCMVYRNVELALQWQETCRAAMTEENAKKGWFLRYKTQEQCANAPPCDIAAWHNIRNQSAPLIPCNKTAPKAEPNCPSCCNFTQYRVYNEPIGGPWPPNPLTNGTRFGNNALNDGQFFWDYRNLEVQDYFAENVILKGAMNEHVDGIFTDDPGGFGQEHAALQAAVQLSDAEIVDLQLSTQKAWMKALDLAAAAGKYFPQAYRTTPPFNFGLAPALVAECKQWMRTQCAVPFNESTVTFPSIIGTEETAKMNIAAFLVARGPYSYISAPPLVGVGDWNDPLFRLHRLDTGVPLGSCLEDRGVFSREWTGGKATVDCGLASATLDFKLLPQF